MSVTLTSIPHFKNIKLTNSDIFYEAELFPALLLRKWAPAHVHVFHNGKVLITGAKTLCHAHRVVHELIHFLQTLSL